MFDVDMIGMVIIQVCKLQKLEYIPVSELSTRVDHGKSFSDEAAASWHASLLAWAMHTGARIC